jgi:cytochrome c peroxidase
MIATGAELEGAFKPSSLRNIAKTSPYMHAGHFASLQEVLEHYNRAPAAPVGDTELKPLNLSVTELAHLEAFSARPQRAPQDAAGVAVNNTVIMGPPANRCTDRTRLPMN